MGPKSEYGKKLLDPRWQMKRLEVFKRENATCQFCKDKTQTLHVHHLAYHGDPWDTPLEQLLLLCESCHEVEERGLAEATRELVPALRRLGFTSVTLESIPKVFSGKDRGWMMYEPAFDIIRTFIDDDELWELATKRFWEKG